jgi:hypothetical protein
MDLVMSAVMGPDVGPVVGTVKTLLITEAVDSGQM